VDGFVTSAARALRIGIITDGLMERTVDGEVRIANGGVGVYIYQLLRHLLEADPINEYFLIRFGEGRLDIYNHPRARNVFLRPSKIRRALSMADLPYAVLAGKYKLDLLHYPNQFGGAFLPRRIKRVATLHDLTPLLFPHLHPRIRVLGFRLLARGSLRRCDRIIVYSANTRRDLLDRAMAAPEAIVNIPLGVNPGLQPGLVTEDFARRYQLKRPFILTVGVLEPRKNHIVLFEMLRRLRQSGQEIDLIVIGREGWHWSTPLARPEYSALAPWVRILADIPERDLAEFYSRAAMFVYPSLYEGFGLPILEAMACGAPVICSSSSSLPEVAGEAALYADPHDAEGFTKQAARLLADPGLRQRMIQAGLERARQFSWRRTAEQTIAVYHSICGVEPTDVFSRNGTAP
jgi:glycosyltransferase involved in cell wall biosynthesis